ncbi:hypothetical protein [Methylobacterium soli]|uniref:Uncharacterized protein n=1 Tax=Methylobacterium soli TaxID=553447 RepID=A0A6L3T3L9_9HYPH|nr:hypothetical protein [Methylobacterium soli]KAB1081429.1 hypothetical protein F6X53_03750 [Methylobacterium soli]GJE43969.1 hypothetical protein AEGHOMDF_3155 [Methylobacterium soli]
MQKLTFKRVLRFDPTARKLRLFRVMWNVGIVGDGKGYSRKVAVALRPALAGFKRSYDEWRVTLLGVEVHSATSWGGRYV